MDKRKIRNKLKNKEQEELAVYYRGKSRELHHGDLFMQKGITFRELTQKESELWFILSFSPNLPR